MTHDPLGSLTSVGGVATDINNEARLKRRMKKTMFPFLTVKGNIILSLKT